jgi:DNA-binding MarR family transcriptional regulator
LEPFQGKSSVDDRQYGVYTPFVNRNKAPNRRLRAKEYLASCACFNLRAASRRVTSLYNMHLKESGVLITQLPLLGALAQAGPVPLTRLAQALEMDRTTLARNWLPLLRGGLTAEHASDDKRVRVFEITAKGRKALAKALALWESAQREAIGTIGKESYSAFLAQLGRLQQLDRNG